jgi:indole-3-glycerol phosphate synthase
VLTEEGFFQGALAHLRDARGAVSLPVLRKDFIVDPWQVWEARAAGADSFLLIVAVLSRSALGELIALGRELKMEPLVEVHTAEELDVALAAGARIMGVNNRDLHTLIGARGNVFRADRRDSRWLRGRERVGTALGGGSGAPASGRLRRVSDRRAL